MESLKVHDVYSIAPHFDEMDICSEILQVPVSNEVLQVGFKKPEQFTDISVTKDESGIAIARIDKKPIQVAVHPLWNLVDEKVRFLFETPVNGEVRFKTDPAFKARKSWNILGDNLEIADRYALLRFTKEVGLRIVSRHHANKLNLS